MSQVTETVIIPTICEESSLLPHYASSDAAGADLKAAVKEPLTLKPGASALIPTGLRFAIPSGYEVQIRPRSGLALKHQITVLNTPGTIDADYRGEVGVILINHGSLDFVVTPGLRIAQMVIAPVVRGEFCLTSDLSTTTRGGGGFGHTGIH